MPDVPILPRLESPVPAAAVGTYYDEFMAWCAQSWPEQPLPWQRRVVARALEHDSDGRLVHRRVGVSVPRQVGKSVLLRMMAAWRICSAELFGEPQVVLHVAHALNTTEEVFLPAVRWAKAQGHGVREANGQMRIQVGESRWVPRSTQTGYGFTLSLALVDEAWAVAPRRVDSGYAPTLSARVSGQVWMFSSANEEATALFPRFREAAGERPGWLLLEWSAPPDADPADPAVAAAASPVPIDVSRRDLMDDELVSDVTTFAFERLNRWPRVFRSDPWLPMWEGLRVPWTVAPMVVAVECQPGASTPAVAFAGRDGERVVVRVVRAGSMAEASELVKAARLPLLVGKSLAVDPAFAGLAPQTRQGTAAECVARLRQLAHEGVLRHDGGAVLSGQVTDVEVGRGSAGAWRVTSQTPVDAVKAAVWAVEEARAQVPWFSY